MRTPKKKKALVSDSLSLSLSLFNEKAISRSYDTVPLFPRLSEEDDDDDNKDNNEIGRDTAQLVKDDGEIWGSERTSVCMCLRAVVGEWWDKS